MLNKFKKFLNILAKETEKYEKINFSQEKENVFDIIDKMYDDLREDVIKFEIGEDIINFIDEIRYTSGIIREKIKQDTGFIIPVIRFTDNSSLQENEVRIFLNGKILYSKFLIPNPIDTACEIEKVLFDIFYNHLNEIFTNETTEKYIDTVKKYNSRLASDVTFNLSSTEIKYILTDLLKKNKSIKNIPYIFEKISEQIYVGKSENKDKLNELTDNIIKTI